jgi:hypothetical protein
MTDRAWSLKDKNGSEEGKNVLHMVDDGQKDLWGRQQCPS